MKTNKWTAMLGGFLLALGSGTNAFLWISGSFAALRAIEAKTTASYELTAPIIFVILSLFGMLVGIAAIARKSWHWPMYVGFLCFFLEFFSAFLVFSA